MKQIRVIRNWVETICDITSEAGHEKEVYERMRLAFPESEGYAVFMVVKDEPRQVYRDYGPKIEQVPHQTFPPFFINTEEKQNDPIDPFQTRCLLDEFYKNNPHTQIASISCPCPKCSVRCGIIK